MIREMSNKVFIDFFSGFMVLIYSYGGIARFLGLNRKMTHKTSSLRTTGRRFHMKNLEYDMWSMDIQTS